MLGNSWAKVERKCWKNKFILRAKKMFMPDILLAFSHLYFIYYCPRFVGRETQKSN